MRKCLGWRVVWQFVVVILQDGWTNRGCAACCGLLFEMDGLAWLGYYFLSSGMRCLLRGSR